LEPEYPFEWSGDYELAVGDYEWVMEEGPDPAMNWALLPAGEDAEKFLMQAVLVFSDEEHPILAGGTLQPGERLYQLALKPSGQTRFHLHIPQAGRYVLFTEHHPDEFSAALHGPQGPLSAGQTREYKPDHEHDDEVTSVGITIDGDLNLKRLNEWLGNLLRTQGPDIFRMKGVLSIQGQKERFVFQGVHMLFDGRPDKPWGKEARQNRLIFIGRKLDREALVESFRQCLA
jgi:hypothetical protein